MNYLDINNNKQFLIESLTILAKGVLSSGGDGWGLWYSKYYKAEDLANLAESIPEYKMFTKVKVDDSTFRFEDGQESILITNIDSLLFDNRTRFWYDMTIVC